MPSTKKKRTTRKSTPAAKTTPRASAKTGSRASTNRSARTTTRQTTSAPQPPPPAYFLSLTLENVRCFGPEQTLDLSNGKGRPAQWTIILGDNGVGKTTLLQSIVALVPTEDVIDSGAEEMSKELTPRCFHHATEVSDWYPFRDAGDDNFSYLRATFFQGGKLAEDKTGAVTGDFTVEGDSVSTWTYAELSVDVGPVVCFGYGASRRSGETSLSNGKDESVFASLFSEEVALLNAEEWLLQSDYAARAASDAATRNHAAKRRDDIKKVLIKLLPDVEEIRFTQITQERMKPGIEVKTPYGWVTIQDLSLGYRTLIAWMVDFASRMFERYPESENPLAEPAVVLVDEIDLHLHPRWQRELVSFLSELFPNTQFIATTHSPLVVQAATDANLVVLRREGDHVVIDNEVVSVDGWRVDQILTGEPFGLESARPPQLDHMIAARREILSKSRMTPQDRTRLRSIESELGNLPAGETPEEMRALDIITRAAARIRGKD